MNKIIDYCDVLIAKRSDITEEQKKTMECLTGRLTKLCKEKQLKVLVVDSEATIRNKRVIWKVIGK